MENTSKDEIALKLLVVLKKITTSKLKILDSTLLEKLLSYIKSEFCNGFEYHLCSADMSGWLCSLLENWKKTTHCPNVQVMCFVVQLLGELSKKEPGFNFFQKINAVEEVINILHQYDNNSSLNIAYIRLLSNLLNHSSGFNWIKNHNQWNVVIKIYFSNINLYVEKESLSVIVKFLEKAENDKNILKVIIKKLFFPDGKNDLNNSENYCSMKKLPLVLKALEASLKMCLLSEKTVIYKNFTEIIDFEMFLNSLLNSKDWTILDYASRLYVMHNFLKFEDKVELLSMENIPDSVLEIFYTLLKQNQIEIVIKLAKFCQILWCDVRKKLKCECTIGVHFIILQLIPVFIYNKKPPDTFLFDMFVQKLFSLTSVTTQKLGYYFRDVIKNSDCCNASDLALRGVILSTESIDVLHNDEAVVIFQSMAYVLKAFVPTFSNEESCICNENSDKNLSFSNEDSSLLSAVLNALCVLIDKFKINWAEALESLCLLKMTCSLLQLSNLSSIVVVQTFLLMKLAILNFMSPDLALLLNNTEDSSFESLMSVLYRRILDPNWEVRDSSIEVITAIVELAESKYPAFQQLLLEKNFCSIIFNVMEGDSESYVRASAFRALSAMTKIKVLNTSLKEFNLPLKIIHLLQTESEGIVRREAALLMKDIYVSSDESEELISVYEVMSYTALCDLHWEVKVNSLIFWEAVIQHVITDQGMIDGSFPKVTFSKESKKIVTLTNDEIKLSLDRVLQKLSKIGCLYILLSTLHDECDFPVVKKSAQILSNFLNILKKYDVIKSVEDTQLNDRIPMKRKNSTNNKTAKTKLPNLIFSSDSTSLENMITDVNTVNSDEVIEEIVNDIDINLLVTAEPPKQTASTIKKAEIKEIKPEIFLMQVENFDYTSFLKDKQKWFLNVEIDLNSLVNDLENRELETNVMDCY